MAFEYQINAIFIQKRCTKEMYLEKKDTIRFYCNTETSI